MDLTSSLSVSPEGVGDLTGWTVAYAVQTDKGNPNVIAKDENSDGNISL